MTTVTKLLTSFTPIVIPAQAGIQIETAVAPRWTPAFTGVTESFDG